MLNLLVVLLGAFQVSYDISSSFSSWLYASDVTVSRVEAAEEKLTVCAIFSEQTLSKFLAKFSGDHVTMTPCPDKDLMTRTQ